MIIRSLRNITSGYHRNISPIIMSDNDELIMTTSCTQCKITTTDEDWPSQIVLQASIHPIQIDSTCQITRIDNGKIFSTKLYQNPNISLQSHIKNQHICCQGIDLKFEEVGQMINDDKIATFYGHNYDGYTIHIENNTLYHKSFLTSQQDISEIIVDGNLQIDGKIAQRIIYPYGGICDPTAHPKTIESCIFYAQLENEQLALKIVPLSAINSVDPTVDTLLPSKKYFVGVKNFQPSQVQSLYDDVKCGSCRIQISHNSKKNVFVSDAMMHIPNTNLVYINFKKENLS